MTVTDALNYATVGNPVSKKIISTTLSIFKKNSNSNSSSLIKPSAPVINNSIATAMPPLWKLMGRHHNFYRLAGLSGASAVFLGAIGSHVLSNTQDKAELKNIFETANRFHFFHSLALLAVPLAKYPVLSGTLMSAGTLLFSGSLYYRAFSGKRTKFHFAPMGGICLIFAWLSLML